MGTSQYVLGFGFWIRSDRNTVPRAEAEKRGEGHADAARSWRGTGQLHDEATAPWVIRSCVHTPLTADERAADAKQRATTAAAFLDSLRHSSVEEGAEEGFCVMSALLTTHSSGTLRTTTPIVSVPPNLPPPIVQTVTAPAALSPPPTNPPQATKRERSPSQQPAANAPQSEEPVDKKPPRAEPPTKAAPPTKPAPKSRSKKAPVAGQMKLNFSKMAVVPDTVAPSPQIELPPAPQPTITSENDELIIPEEGEVGDVHAEIHIPFAEPPAPSYPIREGERQADNMLSSVNDDLVMGHGFDEPIATPTPPADLFGAIMSKQQVAAPHQAPTSSRPAAASHAQQATLKQSAMMGALFNPALVAFQKQFEKRTKNLIKRKPDGSIDVQQISIRVRLGPMKEGKPTVLEEMTEEEYRQQCDTIIQKNKAGAASQSSGSDRVPSNSNPFISH